MEFDKDNVLNLMDRRKFSNNSIIANLFKISETVTMRNFNLEIKNYLIENKNKLNKAGSKLSPNFLNYVKQHVPRVKILVDNKSKKAHIFFNDFDGDKHIIPIRNQDYFAYRLISKMYKQLLKKPCYENILNNLFEKKPYLDNYFLGSIENIRPVNKNKYRTDLEFKFNIDENNFIFVLEYLEDHHDETNCYDRDNFRLFKLQKQYEEIKAAWLITEKNLINDKKNAYSNQISKISKSLISLIFDVHILENKDDFVIDNLELITKNKEFSETLYESYKNEYEYVIPLVDVNKILNFKDDDLMHEYMNYFITHNPSRIKVVLNNESEEEPDEFDSDDESDEESSDESEDNYDDYYDLDENGQISKFNFEGFQMYLMCIHEKYLKKGIEGRKNIYKLYIDITRELISTLEQRFDKLKSVVNQSFVIM